MRSIQAFKVIGTISLGLLTGTLISTPLITVPALLSLPSSISASTAYDTTLLRLQRISTALSAIAVTMYTTTLILAQNKHPYLMYSGFLSAVAGIWIVRIKTLGRRDVAENGFEYLEDNAENAEVVKDRILGLNDYIGLGISGVGFVFAVIGGYGEGFTD